MKWALLKIKSVIFLSTSSQQQQQQQPFYISRPSFSSSSSSFQSNSFDLNSKISPNVLLIIIIIAMIFFVSGLLHLLIRFLFRPRIRRPEGSDSTTTALQGQLQQLFNLHDSGVDQSFIDTLPVFHYKAIIGLKDPFDCAVCLCEFEAEDMLRLLPKCSHAFHMDCIDTWLLTHSTCPLCRANLLHDFSTSCSPIVLVIESESESSREMPIDYNNGASATNADAIARTNLNLGFQEKSDPGSSHLEIRQKSGEISRKEEFKAGPDDQNVFRVKLGKYKNIENGGEASGVSSNNNNADARRCYSMGHFEYVMNEDTCLRVPITMEKSQVTKKKKKPLLPLGPGHRAVKSVCIGGESRREFVLESAKIINEAKRDGSSIVNTSNIWNSMITAGNSTHKKESFSISKIWLRGTKNKERHCEGGSSSERRAFSFRFPVKRNFVDGSVPGDDDDDDDVGGGDLQTKTPSFGRKNMFCHVWRQNKVASASPFAENV